MIKKTVFLLCCLLMFTSITAQSNFVLQIVVDSAFIRETPSFDASPVASVFEEDNLIVVGRNVDGEWLEVRRPAYENTIGWIHRSVTSFTFEVARLPITDLVTGVTGPDAVIDTGYAVLTIGRVPIYQTPERSGSKLEEIPVFSTVPVSEITPNLQWMKVNYRGTQGWIQQFMTSGSQDINGIPVSEEYASDARFEAFEPVSTETQLAKIDDFLAYLRPLKEEADQIAGYWYLITIGETLECQTRESNYTYYPITLEDLRQLPELRQQERFMKLAVDDLNAAIDATNVCGIRLQNEIRQAYADALNASGIFDILITRMENLRERITG